MKDVLIVGGGTIGLATGFELVKQGITVTIFERGEAGRGTSWQAAGMLAPDAEIGFEELELYRLSRESLRRWPDFADDVESAAGAGVDYRDDGTLIVADDRDSAEKIRRLYEFQREHGLAVEWLTGEEAREIEPFVAPRLSAAIFAPSDHQVDNRRLMNALRKAFVAEGGTLHEHTPVAAVDPDADRPAVVTGDGQRVEGDAVVVAAGVWSRARYGCRCRSSVLNFRNVGLPHAKAQSSQRGDEIFINSFFVSFAPLREAIGTCATSMRTAGDTDNRSEHACKEADAHQREDGG